MFYQVLLCLAAAAIAGGAYAAPGTGSPFAPAINGFGFHALKTVAAEQPKANICLSPLSLHLALDMALSGSTGTTAQEMCGVLGIDGNKISITTLGHGAADIIKSLNDPGEGVSVTVADSLWVDSKAHLKQSFVDNCQKYYGAEVANLDLSSPASIDRINAWVSDKTHGKIDKILDKSNTGETSILANALYFKAPWQDTFSKNFTTDKPFHVAGGATAQVPLMDATRQFDYVETADAQVISLLFSSNGRFAFVVALPKTEGGLPGLVSHLDNAGWEAWIAGLTPQQGQLQLPRFKMNYAVTMNGPLKKMGMVKAFDRDEADFRNMSTPPPKLFIDFVKHNTYLSVDENGAEAAAATTIAMGAMAMRLPPAKAFTMVVDHPFLCAIVNTQTKVVLFEGLVSDPR